MSDFDDRVDRLYQRLARECEGEEWTVMVAAVVRLMDRDRFREYLRGAYDGGGRR